MKKFIYSWVFALVAVAFAACGEDEKNENPTPNPGPEQEAVQLAAPVMTIEEVTSESITLSWEAVEHAGAYSYAIGTTEPKTTTKLTVTFTELEPESTYSLRVKAVSNNLTLYTDSEWTIKSVTTPKAESSDDNGNNNDDNNDNNNNDNNEQPGSSAVQEGYYHIVTAEYEDGSPYYNEIYVEHQGGTEYYIYNFFDYSDEVMLATYDAQSSTLTLSGESLYEGEVSQFFGYAWYYYDEEQTMSVGLFSFLDLEDEEAYGDDPFPISIDANGYLKTAQGNILELVIDEETGESLGYISVILAGDEFTYGEYYTESAKRSTQRQRVAAPALRKANLRSLKALR